MSFNSLHFLIFFALVLALYWVIPNRFRWILLLAASYYFYMSWNAVLVFLIAGTTLVSYGASIAIEKTKRVSIKKLLLALTLIVCLGTLVFFKYFNFLLKSAIDFLNLFSLNIDSFALDLLLPVGISFYTFQTLSYVIDVYRGDFKAEKHLGYYALYVSYFPQLVAGPIERPGDLLPQLRGEHKFNTDDLSAGFRIMLTGFFRKCVVADFCGIYVNNVYNNIDGANSLAVLIASALFCVQMYCDFAGYSEIALGAARMMGVRLTENFDRPYLAQSFTGFFRRWHITLTRWFTYYLYIPLGGNRQGTFRTYVNNFLTMLIGGLWHGAAWKFVFWGAMHGVGLAVNKACRPLTKHFDGQRWFTAISWLLTIVYVSLLWVFFRADSWTDSVLIIKNIFCNFSPSHIVPFLKVRYVWVIMMTVIIISHSLPRRFYDNLADSFINSPWAVKLLVFMVVVQFVVEFAGEEIAPFIYFQF